MHWFIKLCHLRAAVWGKGINVALDQSLFSAREFLGGISIMRDRLKNHVLN